MSGPLTPEIAIEALARALYRTMERLDPSDEREWDELSEHEKEFYRFCIKSIVAEHQLVRFLLSRDRDFQPPHSN